MWRGRDAKLRRKYGTLRWDGLTGVHAIAAASSTTCALLSNGSVKCWGSNSVGQLGDGTTNPSSSLPVSASGLSGVTVLSGGNFHVCALLPDGAARCWGANASGQLGNGTSTFSSTPTPQAVLGVSGAIGVAAGGAHSCALLANGSATCWGDNSSAQLGTTAVSGMSLSPVPVLW